MSGAPTKPGWEIALEDRRRNALIEEARAWRTLGHWVDQWPKKLNNDQITGAVCFFTNDSDTVQRMIDRLVEHKPEAADRKHFHDQDYIATTCLLFAAICEDEAQSLARQSGRTQKKKGGRR